jgi:hypothetical protein
MNIKKPASIITDRSAQVLELCNKSCSCGDKASKNLTVEIVSYEGIALVVSARGEIFGRTWT